MIGAVLLQQLILDRSTREVTRDALNARYRTADKSTTEFLAMDIRIAKWHVFKEGGHGGLEIKLAPDMAETEAELTRVMVESGAKVFTNLAPRAPRVRELDTRLQGTWRGPDNSGGSGARSSTS